MIPAHFPKMVVAETKLVFGRMSGKMAVVVAILVGIGAVALMHLAEQKGQQASANGMPISTMINFSAADCAGWALRARNFFVLPLVLLLASAGTLGGELQEHNLREVLVRPVSRLSTLLAKVLSLLGLSLSTLVATLVVSFVGGAVLFGTETPADQVLLGYLATWASDLGLIAVGLLISTLVRGVGTVVVVVVLGLMVDLGARAVLGLLGLAGVTTAQGVGKVLPGAALAAWEGWNGGWEWEPFLGLAVVIFGCLAATAVRFQRMDVP